MTSASGGCQGSLRALGPGHAGRLTWLCLACSRHLLREFAGSTLYPWRPGWPQRQGRARLHVFMLTYQ